MSSMRMRFTGSAVACDAGAEQTAAASLFMHHKINGGGGSQAPKLGRDPTPSPTAMTPTTSSPSFSPTAMPQGSLPQQEAVASLSRLVPPSPLGNSQAHFSLSSRYTSTREDNTHPVMFTSTPDTTGIPATQSAADGKTATWFHNDPTRPGGHSQDSVAWDFTKPVIGDMTLAASWGRWTTSYDRDAWQDGTDMKAELPTDLVRFARVAAGGSFIVFGQRRELVRVGTKRVQPVG